MTQITHFFLGANSGEGFQNQYKEMVDRKDTADLLILKGGPGVGKATFMWRLGRAMEKTGTRVEYIHCSGDPDSLDGVLLPDCKTAVVDGTAPHVMEPIYVGAVDRYVDLGRFYDLTAAKTARTEIIAHSDAYRAAYARAFRCLKAARQLENDANAAMQSGMDYAKLNRRTLGIIARELHKKGGEVGKTTNRFLGSITNAGYVWRFDSVAALCPKIYELSDNYELGADMLKTLHRAAEKAGYDTIACRNPEAPEKLQHLLIPKLGLAFLTASESMAWGGAPYRRIRLDAMAAAPNRARVRFARRMVTALRAEAIAALCEARREHDALEAIYNPYVDFDGVRALADLETERMMRYLQD